MVGIHASTPAGQTGGAMWQRVAVEPRQQQETGADYRLREQPQGAQPVSPIGCVASGGRRRRWRGSIGEGRLDSSAWRSPRHGAKNGCQQTDEQRGAPDQCPPLLEVAGAAQPLSRSPSPIHPWLA